jgi:hypothetical protein
MVTICAAIGRSVANVCRQLRAEQETANLEIANPAFAGGTVPNVRRRCQGQPSLPTGGAYRRCRCQGWQAARLPSPLPTLPGNGSAVANVRPSFPALAIRREAGAGWQVGDGHA